MRVRRVGLVATLVSLSVTAACGGTAGATTAASGKALPAAQLALVAYSTPQTAYQQIIKAFQKTPQGKRISFTQSYGASGDQSRAVDSGQAADVVAFSLAPDITRLVKDGIVASTWNANEHQGMVTDSVAVIATRNGNPDKLRDWRDLTRSGVDVISPNPFTSGGARWNVMAAYGAESNKGADQQAGVTYLGKLFKNISVQDDSARKSLQTFTSGKGDALISYENDAIFAKQHGQALDYTIPAKTILIENPVAVTSKSKHPQQAKAFVNFLYTKAAQKIFAANGYRPVVKNAVKAGKFKTPSGLFTIKDLGGWTSVTTTFFDPNKGIAAGIERSNGVSTSK